jgi:CRP-like cAMP-binding protein
MQTPQPRKHVQDALLAEGVLRNLALFAGASRQTVKQAALTAELRRLARGEVIVRREEAVPGLFALAYGSVKTRLRQPQGGEVVLSLLGPGDTLAEAPTLLGAASKLDAIALAESMVVMIPAACVLALMERDARFLRNLAVTLASGTQTLLAEFESGMLRSAQRLAAYLDSLAQPAEVPGEWTARLPVSKTLLAARLGVKKETLSRLLRQLAARGVISVAQREIRILDRAGLAAAARSLMKIKSDEAAAGSMAVRSLKQGV